MKKRNLFAELTEGFEALSGERQGKQTLRTHEVQVKAAPDVAATELVALRERLHLSRPVRWTSHSPPNLLDDAWKT